MIDVECKSRPGGIVRRCEMFSLAISFQAQKNPGIRTDYPGLARSHRHGGGGVCLWQCALFAEFTFDPKAALRWPPPAREQTGHRVCDSEPPVGAFDGHFGQPNGAPTQQDGAHGHIQNQHGVIGFQLSK